MSDDTAVCASCGRTREQARLLVSTGRISLCDECIKQAEERLAKAIDDDMRARYGSSESVMAEELALNLMDALDATRTTGWTAPVEQEPVINDYLTEPSTGAP